MATDIGAKPIRVDWVDLQGVPALAASPGRLGMTFLPGKKGDGSSGKHHRDLPTDARRLHIELGVDAFVLLVQDHELVRFQVADIGAVMAAKGIDLIRFPIPDGGVPSDRAGLAETLDGIRTRLGRGETVVVACRGGLGRTGTVVGCLLREGGLDGPTAIALTRASRHGTIENDAQERFVATWTGRVGDEVAEVQRLP